VERVEVLPFHQLGSFKWEKLGLGYTLKDTRPPSAKQVEEACKIFRDAGVQAY
jgi:pyruvate formate lyase activating enzyme